MVLLALAEGTKVDLIPDGTVFIHIALILLMIYVLNHTFFKPINRILQARDKNKDGLSEADQLLSDVAVKEARYNDAIRDARSTGYGVIEETRSSALAKKAEAIGAAKTEVETKVAADTAALAQQTADARATIAAEAEKMADKISATILRG